ncbi:MAG: acyl-CoA carboxylase subunit beta [Candidatus Hodarchaeales archaeon]|jgi:acetyl-CoA carboxylase carboxyltransferase component
MPNSDNIQQLREMRKQAHLGGGKERIERQRKAGKLTARERIDQLLDSDSFVELDTFGTHQIHDFQMQEKKILGDGVVTGYGTIDGRLVFIFSQDFTAFGGALGDMFGKKICKIMDLALDQGAPFIGLNDSAGARIQEGVLSLGSYGEIFYRNTLVSGVIPQISAIMGPCAGGAVYSPVVTDFTLMVDKTSFMHITGPQVIKAATGEETTSQALGGPIVHNSVSGVADLLAPDEDTCFHMIRALLSFMPNNNMEDPPWVDTGDDPLREVPELDTMVPEDPNKPYNMKEVIRYVADSGDFFEVKPLFAKNAVTGFARIGGRAIGIVGNQPNHLAGTIDIDAGDKIARFVRFCDAFNIPLLTFMDVPGFLPGVDQEHRGIIRHGAKILYAYADCTVPLVTVITKKAYGGAYVVMCSRHIGADTVLAWPTTECAVMGPEGAANIIFRREIAKADDPQEALQTKIDEYREKFASPWIAASHGFIDDVIEPRETRIRVFKAFEMLKNKRKTRPPRKHGNIPL